MSGLIHCGWSIFFKTEHKYVVLLAGENLSTSPEIHSTGSYTGCCHSGATLLAQSFYFISFLISLHFNVEINILISYDRKAAQKLHNHALNSMKIE